jgi:hypothetical protein
MKPARAIFELQTLPLFEVFRGDWLTEARAVARKLCQQHGSATINQVRAICPPPKDADPRVCGAVFHRREFESIGYENSDRRACHGRPISRFRLRAPAPS